MNVLIYILFQRFFQIDGNKVKVPYAFGDISIKRQGADIVLVIKGYVEARFDGNNRAKTCVSSRYANDMTGLCGNMDGNDANDLVTSGGLAVEDNPWSHIQIGDSWYMSDPQDLGYIILCLIIDDYMIY